MDFNLPDIDLDNFDLNTDIGTAKISKMKNRYIKPKKWRGFHERQIKYDNAAKLSKEVVVTESERAFVLVNGNFVFGDFMEAFIVDRNLHVKDMYITTLSLSENNIYSLENLVEGGYIDNLTLIVSDYWYSHEKFQLLPIIYEYLDTGKCNFQLAAIRSHAKITCFETHDGKKCVMHGSANLRSSDNIEQLVVEQSHDLYDFNKDWMSKVMEKYKTINKDAKPGKNKSERGQAAWKTVQ